MPRQLFALIIAYRPGGEKPIDTQLVDTAKLISKRNAPHNKMNIRPSTSGKTHTELELLEAAPLVFPALDRALIEGDAEKRNRLKGSMGFVTDYYDRRAQALYISASISRFHLDGLLERSDKTPRARRTQIRSLQYLEKPVKVSRLALATQIIQLSGVLSQHSFLAGGLHQRKSGRLRERLEKGGHTIQRHRVGQLVIRCRL